MTLGTRISTLRVAKKYSQEYLAEKLGVSRQAVSKWENDINSPDTKNLVLLAELFGVSVEYLVTGNASPNIKAEENSNKYAIFKKLAFIFFLIALMSHCIGLFSGIFTKPLLPIFPYLWYGTSAWAVVLNIFTAIFTIGWICLLVIDNYLTGSNTI